MGLPCVAVPCTVTVSLTVPEAPRATDPVLTCVAVRVLVGEVVVVVAPVVVVVAPVVVVVPAPVVVVPPAIVVVGRVSEPKRMVPTARSPAWSPMASTQVSPEACWAVVGGHGELGRVGGAAARG